MCCRWLRLWREPAVVLCWWPLEQASSSTAGSAWWTTEVWAEPSFWRCIGCQGRATAAKERASWSAPGSVYARTLSCSWPVHACKAHTVPCLTHLVGWRAMRLLCANLRCAAELSAAFAALAPIRVLWHINTQVGADMQAAAAKPPPLFSQASKAQPQEATAPVGQ